MNDDLEVDSSQLDSSDLTETRTTFLRPWGKRDQAMEHLQNGVTALTDLMGTIRQNIEKDADRQDELLNYLSRLPDAISSLPETSRVQGEALKAIQIGIEQQNVQQGKLTDVLERLHESDGRNRESLMAVQERVDKIAMHEEAIGHSLSSVGLALQTVSTNTESSARVLQTLRDDISSRDSELERVIRRQNARFTTLLSIAIVLSVAALAAVVVFGFLGYHSISHFAR